jgi:septal ring factor EnvC (AmiA/AmiB activator)
MKRFPFAMTLLLLFVIAVNGSAKVIKEYASEIQEKTVNLQELKKNLKEKRIEKEKCLMEEKSIHRELSKIDQELSSLQRQREKIRRDITKAENSLMQAAKELKAAGWEKQQWSAQISREADLWYRADESISPLLGDPVAEKLRFTALAQKKQFLTQAQIKEISSQNAMVKWQSAQKQLSDLRVQQNKMIAAQEAVKGQKKELLQSTIGRRVVAEDDIKRLVESAQALEQLITRLGKEKKKTEEELLARKKQQGGKNYLPWPVTGDVVGRFGKSKHPELDTYIISNGIKIRTQSGVDVHACGNGEVIYSGEFRSYGQMIIIDHGGGIYTLYGQLGEIGVEEDQKVLEGAVIGKVAGNGTPVLYFEVRNEGKAEDPLLWLKSR